MSGLNVSQRCLTPSVGVPKPGKRQHRQSTGGNRKFRILTLSGDLKRAAAQRQDDSGGDTFDKHYESSESVCLYLGRGGNLPLLREGARNSRGTQTDHGIIRPAPGYKSFWEQQGRRENNITCHHCVNLFMVRVCSPSKVIPHLFIPENPNTLIRKGCKTQITSINHLPRRIRGVWPKSIAGRYLVSDM